ncbi:MAG: hypothetical protein HUU47_09230 [Bacteroidetes bacterium]|nr:hypothetical protein [Bacteroidota bacterium]
MAYSNCIDNKLWLDYSQQKLEKTELDKILLHTKNCELCNEIKQGIDLMKNNSSLNSSLEILSSKIDNRINQKSKSILFFRYTSAAAVFIAIVGIAWFFSNKTKPEVVIEEINKTIKKESNISKIDSSSNFTINVENKKKIIENYDTKLNETPEFVDTSGLIKSEDANLKLNNIAIAEDNNGANETDDESNENLERNESKNLNETESVQPATTENIKESKRRKAKGKKTLPSNKFYKNVEPTSTDDYLDKNIYNYSIDSISFYKALNFYNNQKYDSCNFIIKSIEVLKESPFFEDFLLLQAKTLIKLERKSEAEFVLKEIINLHGKHFRSAKKLLKSIN